MVPAPRTPDDARHRVLARATPLAQTELAAFLEAGARLPAANYGAVEVREVDARTALTVCGLPGAPWALNPYVGCAHDCAYCYVPEIQVVERARWASYVIVKRNLPRLLAKELRRKERRPVYLSSGTDAYQPVEASHQMTRRCLEQLARVDWPLRLLTRSPLVTRDIDLFKRFSDIQVGLSVPTIDDELRSYVERSAPPIEGRLKALRALADAGLRPFASLIPAYPLLGRTAPDEVAGAFRDAGVAIVHLGAWQYLSTVAEVTARRLPDDVREPFLAAIRDRSRVAAEFADLVDAFQRANVPIEVIGPEPHEFAKREIRWVEGASGRGPTDATLPR